MAYSKTWTESYVSQAYVYFKTGSNPEQSSGTTNATPITHSRSGTKMPDWKEKIRLGQNASTPFTSDRSKIVSYRPASCYLTTRSKSGGKLVTTRVVKGVLHPERNPSPATGTDASRAKSVALSKTYKKLDSELSRLNSPAVIAEFMDVIRQFGSPARSIVDLTNRRLNRLELERRGLKGSTSFKRIKWHEIVASTYLEWSFGLKPLISDTKAAAEALAHWQAEPEEEIFQKLRAKIASRGLHESAQLLSGTSDPVNSSMRFRTYSRRHTESRAQYTVGLQGDIRAEFGSNDRLLQLLGFDHGNWIPAAYEAVPWSWLADYFFNVNNILDAAVTSTARVAWISLAETQKTTLDSYAELNRHLVDTVNNEVLSFGPDPKVDPKGTCYFRSVRTVVNRTVPATLGVPPLYFKHPFEDAGKIANMTAVLFSRKPTSSALWLF